MAELLTVAVLAFVGLRLVQAARVATRGRGRARVVALWRGVRARHVARAVPLIAAVAVLAGLLVQVPGLDWGWWQALGGVGNPVTGTTESTTGTALEWLVPLVFLVLLAPALALFAEAEERIFRLGAESWSWRRRALRACLGFGLVHAAVGVPLGVALALSAGGAGFLAAYLGEFRRTGDRGAALAESTRTHLAYNAVILSVVLLAIVLSALAELA